jgi:hypothetical protein
MSSDPTELPLNELLIEVAMDRPARNALSKRNSSTLNRR